MGSIKSTTHLIMYNSKILLDYLKGEFNMNEDNKDLEQLDNNDFKSKYYEFLKAGIDKFCNANKQWELNWDYRDDEVFKEELPSILDNMQGNDVEAAIADALDEMFMNGGSFPEDDLYSAIAETLDEVEDEDLREQFRLEMQEGDFWNDMYACGYNGVDYGIEDKLARTKIETNIVIAPYNEQNYDMGSIIAAFGSDYQVADIDYIDETYLDNSVTYLVHQQGHSLKELYDAINGKETSSKLINSIVREIENNAAEATCGLTVCANIDVRTYANLLNNTSKYVEFSTDTVLGFHNSWIGGGSVMEIELEKPFVVPTSDIMRVRPDKVSDSGDYSVGETFGGSISNDSSTVTFTNSAPELYEEDLLEVLRQVRAEYSNGDLEESYNLVESLETDAQDLVDRCKEAYANNDLKTANELWTKLYDLFIPENEEEFRALSDEERTHRFATQQKFMDQFTDEEVYAITDYGKRKEYRKMGYDY